MHLWGSPRRVICVAAGASTDPRAATTPLTCDRRPRQHAPESCRRQLVHDHQLTLQGRYMGYTDTKRRKIMEKLDGYNEYVVKTTD